MDAGIKILLEYDTITHKVIVKTTKEFDEGYQTGRKILFDDETIEVITRDRQKSQWIAGVYQYWHDRQLTRTKKCENLIQ